MNLTGLDMMQIGDFRMSGEMISRDRNSAANVTDFAETLRRVAASQTAASGSASASDELPASLSPAGLSPAALPPINPAANQAAPDPSRPASRFAVIDRDSKLFEQCVELEIFLVKNLVNSMRSTIQRSGLIGDSFAGQIYEDMLFDEHARNISQNANFGLAEMAYLELTGQRGRIIPR